MESQGFFALEALHTWPRLGSEITVPRYYAARLCIIRSFVTIVLWTEAVACQRVGMMRAEHGAVIIMCRFAAIRDSAQHKMDV